MANLETLELRISANAQDAAKGLGKLVSSLLVLKNNLDAPVQGLKALNAELEKLKQYSGGAFNNIMKNTSGVKDIKAKTEAIKEQNKAVREATDPRATPIEPAKISTESRDVMAETASEIEETNEGMENTKTFLQQLREGFANMTKGVTDFFSKVKRIATTMLIRSAIKGLIKAVKAGISNLYEWSKLTKGTFSNSMDTAKAKILTLKNSLGASISPLIEALIPLFTQLASVIIDAANSINQFLALLSGDVSWTHAVEQDVDDIANATKKANKTAKEMIASFDELNVLSDNSGNSSGKKQTDYSGMFEEVFAFDSKIRDLVDFINNNIGTLKAMMIEIGAIILGWKLSQSFEGFMSQLGAWIAVGAAVALTITANWMFTNQYLNTGDEGWLLASVLTTAVGTTAAWALAKKLIGGKTAAYVAGVTLTLTAVTDIIANIQHTDVSALSKESILTNLKAALEGGVGVGIILKTAGVVQGTSGLLMAAGGAALVIFGVATGLKTVFDKNISLFSAEGVISAVVSAVAAGGGMAMILKTTGLVSGTKGLLMKGGGAALIIFGVLIGLKTALAEDVELFSAQNIISTVTGAVAVGLGTFLFTGTIVPAVVAAVATFGVLIGLKLFTRKADMQFGKLQLTQDQINAYVRDQMFTATANVVIDNIQTTLGDKSKLEEKIRGDLVTLNKELDVLVLGIDVEETRKNIAKIIGDKESGLVKDISDLCDVNIDLLKLTFTNITAYGSNGQVIDKNTLLSAIPAWQNIKKEMIANGEELTRLMFEGATRQLTPSEEAYEQELLAKVFGMSSRLAKAEEFAKSTAKFKTEALAAMNRNSIRGIAEAFKTHSAENEQTIREALLTQIEGYYELAELETNPVLKQKWKYIADELSAGFEQTVKEELQKENAPGVDMIIEWILGRHAFGSADKISKMREGQIKLAFQSAGLTSDLIKKSIREILTQENGFTQEEINLMDLIGFTGFDLLSDELQKKMIEWITVKPETIQLLKDGLGLDASKIIAFSNWNDFSSREKLQFLSSLKKSFGGKEALEAAKKAGINVGELVAEGMRSTDPDVRKEAIQWTNIITGEVDKKPHTATVQLTYNRTQTSQAAKEFTEYAKSKIDLVPDITAKWKPGAIEKLKEQAIAQLGSTEVQIRASVHVLTGGITNFITKIHNELLKKFSGLASWLGVSLFAGGGFPQSGQLFIANEDGNAELVGKFGNNTAVANQEQMVDAMAAGVYKANEEQNALLLEQNNLLRGILAKEGTVRLSASSALGRTVKQSLSMYGAVTGG